MSETQNRYETRRFNAENRAENGSADKKSAAVSRYIRPTGDFDFTSVQKKQEEAGKSGKGGKLLVFSDSHGGALNLLAAARLHAASSDVVIHLGDGAGELNILRRAGYGGPETAFFAVAGNCDAFSVVKSGEELPELLFLELFGYNFMLCHGHRHGVKGGYGQITAAARRYDADFVLFGHTHIPYQQYLPADEDTAAARPLRLFCPGSISRPLSGPPAYGLIELRENGVLMTNAFLENNAFL